MVVIQDFIKLSEIEYVSQSLLIIKSNIYDVVLKKKNHILKIPLTMTHNMKKILRENFLENFYI